MIRALLAVVAIAGCARGVPATRHYQLLPPPARAEPSGRAVLAVDELAADAAYDDARIVYRETAYRLDYYHYHRWAAPPGRLLADYLREAYARTGRFRAVVDAARADGGAVLGGRVIALEEVDLDGGQWRGRVVLELTLRDADTDRVLWTARVEESEPLRERTPEGLAHALSLAMARVVDRTAQQLARRAEALATAADRPSSN